ncbi:Ppx/GppA phosphatase family protein [Nitriliruptor alkaliphilus]|uniref:Ppx/GppA phosphatase family protein n=1 Tax=Nitriliruptor alkaliphilus TaxID=427918 RepID=UPI000698876F|nr:Ppx/GppA phosphatase family protein [Nitriliruptor alkaliphilus]
MRCSVLDLGSNSFHVLVADVDDTGLVPVEREREMLHLGRVVAQHGRIPEDQVARAAATVAHLSALARRSGSQDHVAVATSALRDADDGATVLARLSEAAGTQVRVLSGAHEARLGYLGVRASVALQDEPVLVLDLGGGSLELTVGTGAEVAWSTSLPLGVSRLSALVERDPPHRREVAALTARVASELDPHLCDVAAAGARTTVAVGGTVRALARVVAAEEGRWLPATLNQLSIDTDELVGVRDELLGLDLTGRLAVPGMKERRADHLHLAAVVLAEVLDRVGVGSVTVSDWGLREGILLDAHGVTVPPGADELRRREVARLRRAFGPDHASSDQVATLAMAVFDGLRPVHGLGPSDRELVAHAARLHDIGESLALRRHHVHGAYLIANAELRGFAPHETAMLATLVRSAPSRGIDASYPPFEALSEVDQDRTRRLLPVLQLATRFARTRDGAVRDARVAVEEDHVTVAPVGHDVPAAPVDLERVARLFRSTYGLPLRVAPVVVGGA